MLGVGPALAHRSAHQSDRHTFDPAGNRLSVARAGAGGSTSYSWDDASRLVSLTNAFNETTSFSLDAAGRITQQVQSNGTKVLASYDSGRGWLNVLEHRKSDDTVLARYEYTRDLAGHITNAAQPGVHSVTYTLDNIYQLLREVRTGTNPYDISYTYDPAGNRVSKTANGVTDNATYGDNNQILTAGNKSYIHDQDGNLTSVVSNGQATSLAWDYNDKLTQISYPGVATNTFSTNDLGQRVSKTDSAGTTACLFDGDEVIADSRADYINGGITGLISERASGATKVYHGDQLSSTRGMTDASQAVTDSREYDAFGLTIASTGSSPAPFRFAGGVGYQADADSGLMLLGDRYYDPAVGRFISRDPIGYSGGLNTYAYCHNDPLGWVDPDGTRDIIWKGEPYHRRVGDLDYIKGSPHWDGPSRKWIGNDGKYRNPRKNKKGKVSDDVRREIERQKEEWRDMGLPVLKPKKMVPHPAPTPATDTGELPAPPGFGLPIWREPDEWDYRKCRVNDAGYVEEHPSPGFFPVPGTFTVPTIAPRVPVFQPIWAL